MVNSDTTTCYRHACVCRGICCWKVNWSRLQDMPLILGVHHCLSLNMLSFPPLGEKVGGGWRGCFVSWATTLSCHAANLCCSGRESSAPPGTKPALIKANSIARCMKNGPHYSHRLGVKFLWGRPIGGNNISEMFALSVGAVCPNSTKNRCIISCFSFNKWFCIFWK